MTRIHPSLLACPANFPALNFISLSQLQKENEQPPAPEVKQESPLDHYPLEQCPANFPALNFMSHPQEEVIKPNS